MMIIGGHQVDDAMFSYIAENAGADTCKLLLKAEPNLSFDKSFAVLQLECRRKARGKIPRLLSHERFLFPKMVSAEQCTHEQVAQFHASQFHAHDRVLDMTMGLGVDDYYISRRVKSLTAIELDPEIAQVGQYNFSFLNPGVQVIHADAVEWLKTCTQQFDAVFIDPARRGSQGQRLYRLDHCQPGVLELLPLLEQRSKRLFLKASPMIDVTQSMLDLGHHLTDVWAVSVKNECKELFFKLDFTVVPQAVRLHALHFDGQWQDFVTHSGSVRPAAAQCAAPQVGDYLYEPNSSIMKLGCYDAVSAHFAVMPVAPHSHLYTSNGLIDGFPGRKFIIDEIIPFKDKEVKRWAKTHGAMNIATRNFRLSAEALRKRLKVGDGGEEYLFATTLASGEQVLLLTSKKNN